MRKKLNLELCLFPSSNSDLRCPTKEANESEVKDEQQHRPLTIVYDGKVCVCDATEIQAKSILMLANKEMQERVRTPRSEPSSPTLLVSSHSHYHNHLYTPAGTSLSMKKSLQRFLQKRKNRIQEASPYHLKLNDQN